MFPSFLRKRLEKHMGTDRMRAFQIAGVHLIGFAGADAFSDFLKIEVFSASPYGYFLGVGCMTVLLGLMSWVSARLRKEPETAEATPLAESHATQGDAGEAPQPEMPEAETTASAAVAPEAPPRSGMTQVVETMEVEIAGFVVGFLASMWVRFTVTGAVPGARFRHGESLQISGEDVSWLFCFCLAAFFFAAVLVRLPATASSGTRMQYFLQRSRRTLSESLLMSFAWLVFFLCQWFLWRITADGADGSHHTAKLTASNALALMASALVFLPMVFAKLLGKADWILSNSEAFVKVAALVLGFSWETAVYMVVQGASESTEGEATKKLLGIATILLILLFILPGWYMHMLPEPEPEQEKEPVAKEKAEEVST